MKSLLMIVFFLALLVPAQAAACLKRDGDWVHGLSKKDCQALRGRWIARSRTRGL